MSEREKKIGVSSPDGEQRNGVEIDLNDSIAQGRYANLAIISHSPTEFVFDFAAMLPGMTKPKVNNRVILTPEHAKRLFMSLQDNLSRYEQRYGAITIVSAAQQPDAYSILNSSSKIGEA